MPRPRSRRRARLSALRRQSRPNRQAPELSAAQLDAIDPGFGRRCLFVSPFDGTAELAPRAGCSNIWHRSAASCRTSRRPRRSVRAAGCARCLIRRRCSCESRRRPGSRHGASSGGARGRIPPNLAVASALRPDSPNNRSSQSVSTDENGAHFFR
jgi:hypothetical protein